MADWTDEEELSGRRAFDAWRFIETERLIGWDWADMANGEKQLWIDRGHAGPSNGLSLPT